MNKIRTPRAFIFDLNGTMIDDIHFHTQAWHDIINVDLGKCISWEDVKVQMYGKTVKYLTGFLEADILTWKKQIAFHGKRKEGIKKNTCHN